MTPEVLTNTALYLLIAVSFLPAKYVDRGFMVMICAALGTGWFIKGAFFS